MELRKSIGLFRNQLIRNTSIAVAGTIVTACANLLWLSLISKNYSLSNYGAIVIAQNFGIFASTFLNIRVSDILYKYHNDQPDIYLTVKLVSLVITVTFGGIITCVVWSISPMLAETLYGSAFPSELVGMSSVYIFFFSLVGYSLPVLRARKLFSTIVAVETVTKIIQVGIIAWILHFWTYKPTIQEIFIIWFLFNSLSCLLLFILALNDDIKRFLGMHYRNSVNIIKERRKEFLSTLFHSNMLGYFKLTSSPGDTFIIGVFGGQDEVAIYNAAQQIINIGNILKNNLFNVVYPHIVQLYGRSTTSLLRFIKKYFWISLLVSLVFVAFSAVFGDSVLSMVFAEQFMEAHEVLVIMAVSFSITFTSLCYYPIAVAAGVLSIRTYVLAVKTAFLLLYISIFGVSAMSFAVIELCFALVIRLVNDYPLHRRVFG